MRYIVLDNKVPAKMDTALTRVINTSSTKNKFGFIKAIKALGYKVAFINTSIV